MSATDASKSLPPSGLDDLNERRRRITRACDPCRRRKARCDGVNEITGMCTRCSELTIECTWHDEVKKRGRRRKNINLLEDRIKSLEDAAQSRASHSKAVPNDPMTSQISSSWPPTVGSSSAIGASTYDEQSGSSSEDDDLELLSSRTWRLELDALSHTEGVAASNGKRFQQKIEKLKHEYKPVDSPFNHAPEEPDFWQSHVLERLMSWRNTRFHFPDPDLIHVLIHAYMVNVNSLWPMFHRPTFVRMVNQGLHHNDTSFACVLLLVCANGARFVDDPRVLPPGATKRAAGYHWFIQTDISSRDLFRPPRLFEVQAYILAAIYGGPIFRPVLTWVIIGIAIRMIQQVGAHTKKVYSAIPNANDELWKRCFWLVHNIDVGVASETGRPPAMCETDFDVEFPIECDDEYWETNDPALAFKQPPGIPSKLSYFIHTTRLRQIQMKAIRSLFAPGSGLKSGKLDNVVMNIDSELNQWLEATPAHVRWDASSLAANQLFRDQAAQLKMEHNHLLIVVHRPFINFDKPTPASLAAHAICTTAARGNAKIFECSSPKQQMIISAMASAMVLLVGLWGANKLKIRVDTCTVVRDVQHCRGVLYAFSPMFHAAESLYKTIDRLIGSTVPRGLVQYSFPKQSPLEVSTIPAMAANDLDGASVPVQPTDILNGFDESTSHTSDTQTYSGSSLLLSSGAPLLPSSLSIDNTAGSTAPFIAPSFWDQDFFAQFDQATSQYQPLPTHSGLNGGMPPWESFQDWGIPGSSTSN